MIGDKCGSTRGYADHVADGTPKCAPCRRAHADYRADYRSRRYLNRGPVYIDVTGTRRRIRALAAIGWSLGYQADRLGMGRSWTHDLNLSQRVQATVAEKVRALYDELSMLPGPSVRAAAQAGKRGWPVPLAWDDDTIDDPAARPSRMTESHRPFDDVAVQRAMHGNDVHLRPPERAEAVRRLTAQGVSAREIAARLRTTPRTVNRNRATPKKAA